jgi:hypothetical protein
MKLGRKAEWQRWRRRWLAENINRRRGAKERENSRKKANQYQK